jgi:mycofactocin precursor
MGEAAESATSVIERQNEVDEPETDQLVEEELLVEEVSIDGMCGVY